jgi:hypothetical protein
LRRWAEGIAAALKPEGFFYIVDSHPVGLLFEEDERGRLARRYDYSHHEAPLLLPAQPDYAEPGHVTLPSAEWIWPLSDILGTLEQAGLSTYEFQEYPKTVYQQFPSMQQSGDGYWRLPEGQPGLQLLFALKASLL